MLQRAGRYQICFYATHVPAVTISDKAFKADQLYFSNTVDPCKWLYCTQHILQATAHSTVKPGAEQAYASYTYRMADAIHLQQRVLPGIRLGHTRAILQTSIPVNP